MQVCSERQLIEFLEYDWFKFGGIIGRVGNHWNIMQKWFRPKLVGHEFYDDSFIFSGII